MSGYSLYLIRPLLKEYYSLHLSYEDMEEALETQQKLEEIYGKGLIYIDSYSSED